MEFLLENEMFVLLILKGSVRAVRHKSARGSSVKTATNMICCSSAHRPNGTARKELGTGVVIPCQFISLLRVRLGGCRGTQQDSDQRVGARSRSALETERLKNSCPLGHKGNAVLERESSHGADTPSVKGRPLDRLIAYTGSPDGAESIESRQIGKSDSATYLS